MKFSAKIKMFPVILVWSFTFATILSWGLVALTHPITMPDIHAMIYEKSVTDVDERPGIVVFVEMLDDGYIGHIFEQGTIFGQGFMEVYRQRYFAYQDSYLAMAYGTEEIFGVAFQGGRLRFTAGSHYPWHSRRLVWLPFALTVVIYVITFTFVSRYVAKRRVD